MFDKRWEGCVYAENNLNKSEDGIFAPRAICMPGN
jgi:hypothetical protein